MILNELGTTQQELNGLGINITIDGGISVG